MRNRVSCEEALKLSSALQIYSDPAMVHPPVVLMFPESRLDGLVQGNIQLVASLAVRFH